MERAPRLNRRSLDLSTALRVEGLVEFDPELEPEWDGEVLIFLQGFIEEGIRQTLGNLAHVARVYELVGGDAVLHLYYPGPGVYIQVFATLRRYTRSLQAFKIEAVRRRR